MTSSPSDKLINQGYQARREHRPEDARLRFAEAVDLCREADDRGSLAQALAGLGQIARDLHQETVALKHYEEAVALYRTLDRPLVLAHAVRHIADILREQEDFDLATPHYLESLQIYRSNVQTYPLDLANAIRGYALLKGDTGHTEEAKQLWLEAKSLYAQVKVQPGVAEADSQIALLEV
jgi:tetratricopeptide (TPR) repeat protein